MSDKKAKKASEKELTDEEREASTARMNAVILDMLKEDTMVMPWAVGMLAALQLLILGLKMSPGYSFPMSGMVSFIPTHWIFIDLLSLLGTTNRRALREQLQSAEGRELDENSYAALIPPEYKDIENTKNRLFVQKLLPFYLVVWIEIFRIDLTRYDITVWAVVGPLVAIVLHFAHEGYAHGSMWFRDSRMDTIAKINSNVDQL